MTENFDSYNAPQFFDFSKNLHLEENADAYFEIDHEFDVLEDISKYKNSQEMQEEIKEYCYTQPKSITGNNNGYEVTGRKNLRRSMSVGDLNASHESESQSEDKNRSKAATSLDMFESRKQAAKNKSTHNLRKAVSNMVLNKDKPDPTRRSAQCLARGLSRDNLDRLAQAKHYSSAQNFKHGSYVTIAEAVRKFQNGTPNRFKSKPNSENGVFNKLGTTIPQSPVLMTMGRQRQLNVLSREEQEIFQYEECQKFKIKAQPLNKKIFHGPLKSIVVEKKATTIPEPFNITSAPRKVMESPKKEVFEFHAKPVPKTLYEPPKLKEVHKVNITKPQTPNFMKRYVKEPIKSQENQEENKSSVKSANTKPVPFSFEKRDQWNQKKKEEMIKKVLEDEKKAREFHARPIPKAIFNSSKSSNLQRSGSCNSMGTNGLTKSEESLSTQFKARLPTVLHKKPFEPKRDERHLIEISEFQLNTEIRVREREKFEQLKKEKEERIALAKQMEEEIRLRMEEKEIIKIRKEAEYKAQPIKKYKELKIQPSGRVTEPLSPKFHTNKYRNKENREFM